MTVTVRRHREEVRRGDPPTFTYRLLRAFPQEDLLHGPAQGHFTIAQNDKA